jgi:crossover junction endodeoxyribonuclease RuvC
LQNTSKIILGIDPGTVSMGYGVIAVSGNHLKLIDLGILKLSSRLLAYEKLHHIYDKVVELIKTHHPQEFAIEAPFFGKNVQSMLKLGRAQGVAIAAAMAANLPVTEYSPKKVKMSITGNGNAEKEQVMHMLEKLLQFEYAEKLLDASDALAVAVCHSFQKESRPTSKKLAGWEQFLEKNPSRIIR